MTDMAGRKAALSGVGAKGFLLLFVPLFLCALPLAFQRSGEPRIGPYSAAYFAMLCGVVALITLVPAVVGLRCRRRGSLGPAQNGLVLLGATAAVLVAAEIVSRLEHPDAFSAYARWGDTRSLEFGFEPGRNLHWTAAGASYTTDVFGFRTNAGDLPREDRRRADGPPRPRIFVLGASSVFGYGLNDTQTWPHLLEQRLRAQLPGVDPLVVNAGANGYNSLQSLLRFYLRVLPHDPTHLVYYEAINDVRPTVRTIDDAQVSEAILFSSTLHDYIAKVNRGKNFYARTNLGYALGQLLDRWFHPAADSSRDDPYARHPEILARNGEHMVRNLRTLADMCRRNHVRLVVLTFLDDSAHLVPAYRAVGVSYYNALLRSLAREEGAQLIDVAADFASVPDKPAYFAADHYHPSPRGADYLATRVADALVPELATWHR